MSDVHQAGAAMPVATQLPLALADGDRLRPLKRFVVDFTRLMDSGAGEAEILAEGSALLRPLIATDDWLPDEYAVAQSDHYVQNLLHCDVRDRFCVVASVWGPGQSTPPHNHLVWGMIGLLRGGEIARSIAKDAKGRLVIGEPRRLEVGDMDFISDADGDAHIVANAYDDRTSISIHVYGANIGLVDRQILRDGEDKPFRSGYSNSRLPNIWAAGQ